MTSLQDTECSDDEIIIESRFGDVKVHLSNAIYFPQGLLGLENELYFALADMPKENMKQFKLLQCLNDHSLSFVVLPLDVENEIIAEKDITTACRHTKISIDNLAMLLVVAVARSPEGVNVTANLRAPILIDTNDKAAIQFVFSSTKYSICHSLK